MKTDFRLSSTTSKMVILGMKLSLFDTFDIQTTAKPKFLYWTNLLDPLPVFALFLVCSQIFSLIFFFFFTSVSEHRFCSPRYMR